VTNLLPQSYKQDCTWKAQMPGRWCVRHSSNRYTATHFYVLRYPFRPYTQIAKLGRPTPTHSFLVLVFILPRSGCVGQPVIITWDSGVICFLALAWSMMSRATTQKMRRSARAQDERLAVLTLLLAQIVPVFGYFMLKIIKAPATILTPRNAFCVTVICS